MARGIGKKTEAKIKELAFGNPKKYITKKMIEANGFDNRQDYLKHLQEQVKPQVNAEKRSKKQEAYRLRRDIEDFNKFLERFPEPERAPRRTTTEKRKQKVFYNGDSEITYTFDLLGARKPISHDDEFVFADDLISDIKTAYKLKSIQDLLKKGYEYSSSGYKTKIIVKMQDGRYSSVPYLPFDDVFDRFKDVLQEWFRRYDNDWELANFQIVIALPIDLDGAGAVRKLSVANKIWIVADAPSRTNCFYNAVCLAKIPEIYRELMQDTKKLYKQSDHLKHRVMVKSDVKLMKKSSGKNEIQACADYLKRTIIIYGNLFDKKYEFNPKNSVGQRSRPRNAIELQLSQHHYKALIRRDVVNEPYVAPIPGEPEPKRLEDIIIKKKKFERPMDAKYAAYDIEATADPSDHNYHKAYACGVSVNLPNGEIKHTQWWGLDCQKMFIDYLIDNMQTLDGYTFYAHNGGKYDYPNLFREQLFDRTDVRIDRCLEQNGRYISFEIKNADGKIKFRDSCCLFPGSLADLAQEMEVKHQKLVEIYNHDQVNIYNFMQFREAGELYLMHDCTGLLECVLKFNAEVYSAHRVSLSGNFTTATLAKNVFYKHFYDVRNYPLYFMTNDHDAFVRSTYYGGRCEAFHIGKITEKLYYDDFTSLYPDRGCEYLPYGKPYDVVIRSIQNFKTFFGFCDVYVRSLDYTKKPLHCSLQKVEGSTRLLFPHFGDWTKLRLFSEEIRLGMSEGIYEYKFGDECLGVGFKAGRFMKPFFEDCFQKKKDANDNPVLRKVHKTTANSGYGFFGLKWKNKQSILIENSDECTAAVYLEQGKLLHRAEHGKNKEITVLMVEKDLPMKDFNVSVASAITSYARMKLWTAIIDIESKGYKAYYCDTDSIISNCNIYEHPDLMAKYRWDGSGDDLGGLKSEGQDKLKKYNKKNPTNKVDARQEGFHFDEGIICGCKFYAVRKNLSNGDKIDEAHLKGWKNKITYDDFLKHLATGLPLTQEQTQFSSPKTSALDEDRKLGVVVLKVVKKFKTNYKKGYVRPDGSVVPLTI